MGNGLWKNGVRVGRSCTPGPELRSRDSKVPITAMFSGSLGRRGMTGLKGDMRSGFIKGWP